MPRLSPTRFLADRDWRTLQLLAPFFREYKGRVLFALATLVVLNAMALTLPFLLKHIVDGLDSSSVQTAALPLALLVSYTLVRFLNVALRELTLAIYGTVTVRAMRRVSLTVLKHLHSLDLEYHLTRRTGGISRDLDRGVNAIASLLRILTFQVLNMFLGVGGVTLVLLSTYAASYAGIVLVAVVFFAFYTVRVTEWRTPFIRESNTASSRANTRAVDSLINYETVKLFGNEAREANLYDRDLAIWEAARARNRYSLAGLNAGQQFFVHCGMFGMMVLAAMQVLEGELTVGDLVAINAFAVQVFVPLNQLGGIYRELKRCFTDVENMFDILETPARIASPTRPEPMPRSPGALAFEHVSFSYDGKRPILRDVSFEVPPHSRVAIVGPSGAGKSTLTRLLFRFYDADAGRITVNGADVRAVDLDALRREFGVVPQDAVLFNASLAENLGYGDPAASTGQIAEAIAAVRLDELVSRLPDGLESVVGERGLKLSGGEKQRVAIARALLKRPQFLVFDEATSSLDSVTEDAIMQAIDAIAIGHTTLIIAHRLSTIVNCDRIYVLDEGRVVESGTHAELLAQSGLYAELWTLQQSEASERAVESIH